MSWRLGWLMRISCLLFNFLALRVVFQFFPFLLDGRFILLNGLLIVTLLSHFPFLASIVFFPFPFCSTDEDTAEYLYDVLSSANDDSSSWLTQERRVIVGAIQGALQGFRGIGKVYEERVAEALATFQLPAPAM
ncbi:hypothetical protein PILCRDRAFT_813027 [Piloderma croceum F 1598]|uniref:Uncharacterized protein n=1 Tax=Piloderma croceum (strain F 1598) TaxID=765440 RepID=A0A0C3CH93_PILCF|nr:hypothetical protein PILCRDRAFT_813027 [Piloderma croceum F 1598]